MMMQSWNPATRLAALALVATLVVPGCDTCGRRLIFVTTVTDSSRIAIAGATVEIDCVDAVNGDALTGAAATDQAGKASPSVHALNRACPEDEQAHAGYFQTCSIVVHADGFHDERLTISGAELDDLPEEDVGQAGYGVRLAVTLIRDASASTE